MLNMKLVHYTRILLLANACCSRTAEGARIGGAKGCHGAASRRSGAAAKALVGWAFPGVHRKTGHRGNRPARLPPSPANITSHRAASGRGDSTCHAGVRAGLCQDPEHSPGMEIADKRN